MVIKLSLKKEKFEKGEIYLVKTDLYYHSFDFLKKHYILIYLIELNIQALLLI